MKIYLDLKDKRINYLKNWLIDSGQEIDNFDNFENIKSKDLCLLSPAFKFSTEIATSLPENINILSGDISEEIKEIFKQKNIYHYSFMSDEIFVLKNASLTAEGMLAELIKHTKKSIFELKVLILGSGRVAKAVEFLFLKLGVKFDLATRNLTEYQTAHLIAEKCFLGKSFMENLKEYDVIINTIPAKYFEQNEILKFKIGCVLFELASKQCLEGLEHKNFDYILCPALPSVYSHESAADLLKEKVEEILKKEKNYD